MPGLTRSFGGRMRGESYPSTWYEQLVGSALRKVSASASLMAATMPKALASGRAQADDVALRRIGHDREAAASRLVHDRDVVRFHETMARLDDQERQALERTVEPVTPERARHYLENLWQLWLDTRPEGRRAIAGAAFERIEARGLNLVVQPSAEAERYGWSAVFGADALEVPLRRYGRGERIRPFMSDVPTTVHFVRSRTAGAGARSA